MNEEHPFSVLSDTSMVLAAGFGTRLRPLTAAKPKPLFEVGGKTMLDRAIGHLRAAGMKKIVVNAHYLGEQIAAHLAGQEDILLSPETEILDTGGGVKNALPHLGTKPFFVLSADLPLRDGAMPMLTRMARAWDGEKMDALLLVQEKEKTRGFHGRGDFMMRGDGGLWRQDAPEDRPYVWLSVMIVRPELYGEIEEKIFSNNRTLDLAEKRGRLFGLIHDGGCFHVGTPEDLAEANKEDWG